MNGSRRVFLHLYAGKVEGGVSILEVRKKHKKERVGRKTPGTL